MNDNEMMVDVFSHIGEKRHSRIQGYYVCGMGCCNQFIFNRPLQNRKCPECGRELHLLMKVDEFEVNRINKRSGGTLIIEEKERRVA